LRTIRYGPQYSTERPKQPRRRIHLSTDRYCLFSKQRDCGQFRNTFDANATLNSVSLPNDTCIPVMFGIVSISLYRYGWYPLSSLTVSLHWSMYIPYVQYRYLHYGAYRSLTCRIVSNRTSYRHKRAPKSCPVILTSGCLRSALNQSFLGARVYSYSFRAISPVFHSN
jgi:hypothetical protein